MNHCHTGHRARLRKRAQCEGLDNFQPHEVLELFLYNVLPLRDVNPLAHDLIHHFGSVGETLHATEEQLMRVNGIGRKSARWLRSLGEATDAYAAMTQDDCTFIHSSAEMIQYLRTVFLQKNEGQMWIYVLNAAGCVMGATLLGSSKLREKIKMRAIVEPMILQHGKYAVIAQWRSPGNVDADEVDERMARSIGEELYYMQSMLLDFIILSQDQQLSLRKEGRYEPCFMAKNQGIAEPSSIVELW